MAGSTTTGIAQKPGQPEHATIGAPQLAGRALRGIAFVVDALLFVPLLFPVSKAVAALGASPDLPNAVLWYPWLGLLLAAVAYQAIFVAAVGATPGMLLAGIWVADASGESTDAKQALARAIVSLVSAGCFGLGYLWGLLDPKRRTWHDLVAGTIVVAERPARRRRRPVRRQQAPKTYHLG
jgi:uncharacterized RDD family membrane protein YckC